MELLQARATAVAASVAAMLEKVGRELRSIWNGYKVGQNQPRSWCKSDASASAHVAGPGCIQRRRDECLARPLTPRALLNHRLTLPRARKQSHYLRWTTWRSNARACCSGDYDL